MYPLPFTFSIFFCFFFDKLEKGVSNYNSSEEGIKLLFCMNMDTVPFFIINLNFLSMCYVLMHII